MTDKIELSKIHQININKIIPYEKNPRKNNEAVDPVAESIKEFGFKVPIVVDKNNVIITGHTRYKAAKKLKMKTVPCIVADDLTEEQVKALRIVDNKSNESPWDFDFLADELAELDLSDFEFDFGIDTDEEETEIVEDEAPEVDEENEPITKLGDIWQLGRHRLMCGDSTDKETVELLMDGNKADMVMTDPPYGINAEKMTMGTGKRDFHRGEDWDSERPDISMCFEIAPLVCIWGGNYFADKLPVTNDWLIWHKKNDGLSFSECELAWTNFGINCRHISHHWGKEKKQHITMKPLTVIAWAIERAKEKANVIVDLFGGSGSTLIACEQLDRTCYMMELDPKYCDVIIKRWETLTGKKAELVNG
jgi:site-specific DNA-methyltransferase (adenine-specific)